jgi:hypothetical protein
MATPNLAAYQPRWSVKLNVPDELSGAGASQRAGETSTMASLSAALALALLLTAVGPPRQEGLGDPSTVVSRALQALVDGDITGHLTYFAADLSVESSIDGARQFIVGTRDVYRQELQWWGARPQGIGVVAFRIVGASRTGKDDVSWVETRVRSLDRDGDAEVRVVSFGVGNGLIVGLRAVEPVLGAATVRAPAVETAVEAAVLAGARALGRHLEYTHNGTHLAAAGVPIEAVTDAAIFAAIACAVPGGLVAAPNASDGDCGANAPWPGAKARLDAHYLVDHAGPGSPLGAGAVPADATGVRVQADYVYRPLLLRAYGVARLHLAAAAHAMLRPTYDPAIAASAPFIICGGGNPAHGAFDLTAPQVRQDILDPSSIPPSIAPAFIGHVFLLQGAQLNPQYADCGEHGFHGNARAGASCRPLDSMPVPCGLSWETGIRAGPTRNLVTTLPGCHDRSQDHNCVVILPVADSIDRYQAHVVAYMPFLIRQGRDWSSVISVSGCNAANCHTGMLLGAALVDAAPVLESVIDPAAPGVFTIDAGSE